MKENSEHFQDFEVANLILKTNARVIDFATGRVTHHDSSIMLLELDGTKEVLQRTKESFLGDWHATKGPWVNEPHITSVQAVTMNADGKLICPEGHELHQFNAPHEDGRGIDGLYCDVYVCQRSFQCSEGYYHCKDGCDWDACSSCIHEALMNKKQTQYETKLANDQWLGG